MVTDLELEQLGRLVEHIRWNRACQQLCREGPEAMASGGIIAWLEQSGRRSERELLDRCLRLALEDRRHEPRGSAR